MFYTNFYQILPMFLVILPFVNVISAFREYGIWRSPLGIDTVGY